MAMTVCTAEDILAYRACPRLYTYKYRGGSQASPWRPALSILREVTLEAVRKYHQRQAVDLDRLKGHLRRAFSVVGATPDDRETVLAEVLAILDDYTRQSVTFGDTDCEWGRSFAL